MTERCQVCGRETNHVVSIFFRERDGRLRSKYACPDCDALWLAGFASPRELGTQPEPSPAEVDGRQLALFAAEDTI